MIENPINGILPLIQLTIFELELELTMPNFPFYYLPILELKALVQTSTEVYDIQSFESATQSQELILSFFDKLQPVPVEYDSDKKGSTVYQYNNKYASADGIMSHKVSPVNEFLKVHSKSDPPIQLEELRSMQAFYSALNAKLKFTLQIEGGITDYHTSTNQLIKGGVKVRGMVFHTEECHCALLYAEAKNTMIAMFAGKNKPISFQTYDEFIQWLGSIFLGETALKPLYRDAEIYYPMVKQSWHLPSDLLRNLKGIIPNSNPLEYVETQVISEFSLNEKGVIVETVGGISGFVRSLAEGVFKIEDNFVVALLDKNKLVGAAYIDKSLFLR